MGVDEEVGSWGWAVGRWEGGQTYAVGLNYGADHAGAEVALLRGGDEGSARHVVCCGGGLGWAWWVEDARLKLAASGGRGWRLAGLSGPLKFGAQFGSKLWTLGAWLGCYVRWVSG